MTVASNITVPDATRAKFGDLIDLILGSESMNDEERQYWVNILPIMTPEQVQNLRDILENEKRQLEEIDRKYARELSPEEQQQRIAHTEKTIKEKRSQREEKEEEFEKKDDQDTDALLDKIEGL